MQKRLSLSKRLIRSFSTSFSIDRSGLIQYGPKWPSKEEIEASNQKKEPLVPLVEQLRSIIKVKGPISVHDYMAQALNNIQYGYYQYNKENGFTGDFITSPEISPLFCELIGIWCVATWQAMGSPSQLKLVELGPGKGTLMKEILNTARSFPAFEKALTVHMVEVSEAMRKTQRNALLSNTPSSLNSTNPSEPITDGVTSRGIPIHWHHLLREVPSGQSGHEILDAFPIYQFVKSSGKWKEVLVDVDFTEESKHHFRFVQSGVVTPALNIFFNKDRTAVSSGPLSKFPRVNAEASSFLSSERVSAPPPPLIFPSRPHQKLENPPKEEAQISATPPAALHDEDLDSLEISPLAFALVEEISRSVLSHQSAALLVDYGEDYPQGDTLRGFKNHTAAHVLSEPGMVDISADVNFKACVQIAAEQGAMTHGPITQSEFLGRMGLVERLHQLASKLSSEEELKELIQATEKVATGSMGKKFKFLSISHPSITPPGFS